MESEAQQGTPTHIHPYPCDDVGVVGEVGVAVLAAVDDGARRREAHQQQPTHGPE
jgi:hypothetical protein